MARSRAVFIDGSGLAFRAFFAIPLGLSTTAGRPTNATYGFARMFEKLFAGKRPSFGAVVFDAPGKTFRNDRFSEYKAQRPKMPRELRDQWPDIEELCAVQGFPVLRVTGVEADDVIGTLTRMAHEAGDEVVIVSSDKDFAQLVDDDTRLLEPVKEVSYDADLVRKKWGVPPERFVDFLALTGDKVDNVPGVPGIGAKTAQKLLERFGDLEGVLAGTGELKGKQKERLETHAADARMSQELVTIRQDVPLDEDYTALRLPERDGSQVDAFYRELEFFSLLGGESAAEQLAAAGGRALTSVAEARAHFAGLDAAPVAVVPIHTGNPMTGRFLGVAVAQPEPSDESADTPEPRYLAFASAGALGDEARAIFREFAEDATRAKLTHDVRDLYCLCAREDIALRGVRGDTRLVSFLVDPTRDIPHRLDQLARRWLGAPLVPEKEIRGSGKSEKSFEAIPREDVARWAGLRAAAVADSWAPLSAALAEHPELEEILSHVTLPLARVLARMQVAGVRVSAEILERLDAEFEKRKAAVAAEIYEAVGHEFNIGSSKQLGTVLFEELGLKIIKRTKTGYSTNAEVLEKLASSHPVPQLILRWRALAKLINTYTRVLREAIDPATGRVHPTFQQTAGMSGRLITTDPDIQRTPIRTEDGKRIREAFLAREGWKIVSADWSQIELRLMAHISADPGLREAFREGVDVHRRTAGQIYELPPDAVDGRQRNVGKTVNFATIYGQGATALGQSLGIKRGEAKKLIDKYFLAYAGVRTWLDETVAQAYEDGFVTTLAGRHRFIPELTAGNPTERGYGERIATNTPIQGSAADLCKLAMLRIDDAMRDADLDARMLLQIHDELIFEVPPHEVEPLEKILERCMTTEMEEAFGLQVPLVVDIGVGDSWAAAH